MCACVVLSEYLLNGLHQSPKLSVWEFAQAEPRRGIRQVKQEGQLDLFIGVFLSAWPFSNPRAQTSPSSLIRAALTRAMMLGKLLLCVQFSGYRRKPRRNNPFWGMGFKKIFFFFSFKGGWGILSNISTPVLWGYCRGIERPSLTWLRFGSDNPETVYQCDHWECGVKLQHCLLE